MFSIQKSSIFPDDHTYVSWAPGVKKFVYSYILLDILFAVIKCKEVGIAVRLNNGEVDSLWIGVEAYQKDKSLNYSHYIQEMYEIAGIVFKDHAKAEQFYDWLEKKYVWDTLSG